MAEAPPPPPPHGANAKSAPLPNGNYDIFIIPPHSAGSGFLYLPSLKPNLNSFIAGFCSALLAVGLYNILVPALSQTLASLNSGIGILLCLAAVGAAFSFGRTSSESSFPSSSGPGSGAGPNYSYSAGSGTSPPRPQASPGGTPHFTSPPRPNNTAQSSWEKAKEQTRQRAEDRKKAEEVRARQEEAAKKAAEAEKAAKAAAEKERWEQQRAREKDVRERAARERIAKERAEKDAAGKGGAAASAGKKYEKPTAQSVGTDSDYYSQFKPHPFASSAASSVSGQSESSYAPSMSTARTTPPPRDRGPYKTTDPNKVVLLGVYSFTNAFGMKPTSMLEKDRGGVSDGLILRIATEGLFIDDDVRGVGQREWDVKAWSLKLLEIGRVDDVCVFRATLRDVEGKRYVFVLPSEQQWKVDTGLQRLRKGSQVRALGLSTMPDKELKTLLMSLGWK
ncbi:Hypothetical protein D9617_1g082590 [Elsinoe fawcettii]|nr:Hypothetical protein D9617_1g082590 [Elsinoe fawcettii]